MRIAIIDDEPNLIKLVGHTILDYGKIHNLSIELDDFLCGEDFLTSFKADYYDIIFMDVYMPGISGVETVMKLRESDISVPVIFLTTSESHMKDALSCHAFDYLVKPATRLDFFKVLDDCTTFLGEKVTDQSKYIEFKSGASTVKLLTGQIISAVAAGHKVIISTKNNLIYEAKETFLAISDPLSECENFLKINRGIIVNMDSIEEMKDGCCLLTNGNSHMLKVRGSKEIYQAYENYRMKNA
ncbi:MAG: LytTR family DNA-binding domain-containing protein [Lachnospiraceae bacterium]|nr:LytTR family DNA-binding domain-containing protein [Lachnospiraceae bacterium]